MHYFKLYMQFIKIRLSSIVSYRGSFILGVIAQMLSYGAGFFTTWLLVDAFHELNGWTPYEVLLLYGMNLFSYALAAFFLFSTVRNLEGLVAGGGLDAILTKPVNPFMYLVCNGFNTGYFSHITLSLLTIIISFTALGIVLTPFKFIMLVLSILGAALVHAAALIMTSVPTVWMVRGNLSYILYWTMKDFINYPISLYNKIVQVILTFILPYAFINFYPAEPLSILVFFLSILLGAAISFYYSYIMGMLPFWLQSTWYISWFEGAMFTLFAGSFVPLWFYPEVLIKISRFLPSLCRTAC